MFVTREQPFWSGKYLRDRLKEEALALAGNAEIEALLREVCALTGMGFAAVARVSEDRWIACQVLDGIEFGLKAGDELQVATTICNDIRRSGKAVVIDDVVNSMEWRTHPTPILYGFKSYASFPIYLDDGAFFGTLCAIDPNVHAVSAPAVVEAMTLYAKRIAALLSVRGKND